MAYPDKPMRRSALIGPWGVGALVPFPNDESLMIAGLDMWRYSEPSTFQIKDDRLKRRLGVAELRWPPDFRESSIDRQNSLLTIPAVRFPTWHYCPFCGTMEKSSFYQQQPRCECYPWPNGRRCDPKMRYKRKMIPERFGSIAIDCRKGMVDPMSEAFLQMAGVFSQLELAMIRARVKSGMENAKAKGKRIGRPTTTKEDIPSNFLKHYAIFMEGKMNVSELARVCGLSRPTVYKYMKMMV